MKDRTPKQDAIKIEVLQLLRDKKADPARIAADFKMDKSTVYRWAQAAGIAIGRNASEASAPAPIASAPRRARSEASALAHSAPAPANDARLRELEEENDVLARALAIVARRRVRGVR
jgi:transposase-like protein